MNGCRKPNENSSKSGNEPGVWYDIKIKEWHGRNSTKIMFSHKTNKTCQKTNKLLQEKQNNIGI